MKILVVSEYSSTLGGVECYIAQVSATLQQAGHAVHQLWLSQHEPSQSTSNTSYVPVNPYPAPIDETKIILQKLIERERPDVAYVHTIYHPRVIEALVEVLPVVAYVHGPYPVCPGSAHYLRRSQEVCPHTAGPICLWNAQLEHCCWGRNPVKHWRLLHRAYELIGAYHQVDKVLVGSRYMYDLLVNKAGITVPVAILVPVLMDLPAQENAQAAEPPLILFVGRVEPEKGLSHLLHALAEIHHPWQLVVAGDGEELSNCRSLAQRLGIAERVQFSGWLEPGVLNAYYARCALVVVPSLWPEPFGRVGPEAFAYGRPVVAYAVGGIPNWLEHERSGLLVEPQDITGLARAIAHLLDTPLLREQMGTYARRVAEQRFTVQAHLGQLLEHLSEAYGKA